MCKFIISVRITTNCYISRENGQWPQQRPSDLENFDRADWHHVFSPRRCDKGLCLLCTSSVIKLTSSGDRASLWLLTNRSSPPSARCFALTWLYIVSVDLWYASFTWQSLLSTPFSTAVVIFACFSSLDSSIQPISQRCSKCVPGNNTILVVLCN